MPDEHQVAITRTDKGTGWVLFGPCTEQPPPLEATPSFLENAVARWVQRKNGEERGQALNI